MLTAMLAAWLTRRPLTVLGALTPPVCYFLALALLPPGPKSTAAVSLLRSALALWSFLTFLALPFRYYVPASAAFTYQLGLVGWFGAGRVFELFVLAPLLPLRPPAHMRYQSDTPPVSPASATVPLPDVPERTFKDMDAEPEVEDVRAQRGWWERAVWALDLMTAMRGVGWDWATADVRHSPSRWHPAPGTQLYRLSTTLLPTLFLALACLRYLHPAPAQSIYELPLLQQWAFVASLGIALYTLFDVGYTSAALLVGLLIPHTHLRDRKTIYNSLLSFPPLYTAPLARVASLRDWWGRGWHRLFARYFLVYGVWPGHIMALTIERLLRSIIPSPSPSPSPPNPSANNKPPYPYPRRTTTHSRLPAPPAGEWGKVLGAFAISGAVHTVGEFAALRRFGGAGAGKVGGEFWFFLLNGVGVLVEEAVRRGVYAVRAGEGKERSYDGYVGKLWTLLVLLNTGVLFADGWVRSGIIWEVTGGDVWGRIMGGV
ncbi:hypothetical protein GLOTRDRAFT_134927 [Gloeophyllum trabeum ATCC 11539]|uniref:Wax synthase domain-containing protein n=1 Tax=Gloeophyllum trabeum (strain ATCC 11539 / FP-39264 / Madison 617) TaxID=670483 RepID=S7QLG7_GLOTA|nr:uncharacterized protein GLOTRDRAFT_134927 [Gloeophyllum trabeum ATCC 11539]EPQ60202.1 hypothetical protein GLOTRDRAFT_134927 [Gloeophyllum trabeum ATCC 11539]